MEYKEFKKFWNKANRVRNECCKKFGDCRVCSLRVSGDGCAVKYMDDMGEHQFDFIQNYEFTDWSKVPIDAKIVVRMGDDKLTFKRHFAGYENGVIYAWDGGQTSFTATNKVAWKYAELYSEEP